MLFGILVVVSDQSREEQEVVFYLYLDGQALPAKVPVLILLIRPSSRRSSVGRVSTPRGFTERKSKHCSQSRVKQRRLDGCLPRICSRVSELSETVRSTTSIHPPRALSNRTSESNCTPHSNLARLGAAVLGISVANDVGWLADRQCSPNKGGRGQRALVAWTAALIGPRCADSFQPDSIGRAAGIAAAGLHAAPPAAFP